MDRQGKKSLATELRHYVYLQHSTVVKDNEGGFTVSWHTFKRCSCAIYPLRAEQIFQYRSINVEATHLIKMRGYISLTDKDRILFDGRIFEILTIENIQEKDVVKYITCKENPLEGDDSQTTTTTAAP